MALVNVTIPNMQQGVSQQPPILRLQGQCEEQVNAYSTISDGLSKRPPTTHIAKLTTAINADDAVHFINRDADERYVVKVKNGGIDVATLVGVAKTVSYPDGTGYLASTNPREHFEFVTVADTTFILNKNITTAKDSTTSASRPYEAIVFVKKAQFDCDYVVKVNGSTVATKSTSSSTDTDISTLQIAESLRSSLASSLSGYTVSRKSSAILIRHATTDFNIQVEDPIGGTGLQVFKDKTQKFSDLPQVGFDDFVIEITGDATSNFDNYYVSYETVSNDDESEGVWQEAVKPGLANSLDATTMPHKLTRQADGSFKFEKITWNSRICGDTESAPDPSFIGQKLNDIFFFKNRFGVIAGSNLVLSESGEFFNFYPKTVTDILDTTPIDVESSHVKVNTLRHAVLFNQDLYLFSDFTQFKVNSADDILTIKTITIDPVAEYQSDLKSTPSVSGKNIYFAVDKGTNSGIREFFSEANDIKEDSTDVTDHVPNYIPSEVFKIVSSDQEDVILVLSKKSGERNNMYVYVYHRNNAGTKLVSSWSKWTFSSNDTIIGGGMIGSVLYTVVNRSDGCYLDKIDLDTKNIDSGLQFKVHLDRKSSLTGSYDSGTNKTTWTYPYEIPLSGTASLDNADIQVILGGSFTGQEGIKLATERPTTTTVTAIGDYSSSACYVGIPFNLTYEFTEPQIIQRNVNTDSKHPIRAGDIRLKNWILNYYKTGAFTVSVTPYRKSTYTYNYTDNVIGSKIIGDIAFDSSGEFKFPIMSSNKKLSVVINNSTHLPSHFLSSTWEGQYYTRSRRI